jgi:hypothetical protein
MWREDALLTDGSMHRVRKSEVLGSLKEYNTQRLAERARAAPRRGQLANLQTASHGHLSRIRGEVAEGRSNPIQTLDRNCRPVQA